MGVLQEKISKLIQQELSMLFQKDEHYWFEGTMVSVSVVRVTADLSLAKVYISAFGKKKPQEILDILNEHVHEVRFALGNRIKNKVRKIPELRFYIDDSLEYAQKIDELLKN
ncbi:MAG TPA: 30S ribosome-binding factor RbfA [Flavobacteriales bacterium]|nr:30S ribosome-binding factor RbfA [Flavobacteriales bacterium]|tara:strand:+ start:542 stop:877 length:336 start_codon:yes stop_codon:yes gene_type:complete